MIAAMPPASATRTSASSPGSYLHFASCRPPTTVAEIEDALRFLDIRDSMPVDVLSSHNQFLPSRGFPGNAWKTKSVGLWSHEDALSWLMSRCPEGRSRWGQISWEAKVAAASASVGDGSHLLRLSPVDFSRLLEVSMDEAQALHDDLARADTLELLANSDLMYGGPTRNDDSDWRRLPWTAWNPIHFVTWTQDAAAEMGLAPSVELQADLSSLPVVTLLKANPDAVRYIWNKDLDLEQRFNAVRSGAYAALTTGAKNSHLTIGRTRNSLSASGGTLVEKPAKLPGFAELAANNLASAAHTQPVSPKEHGSSSSSEEQLAAGCDGKPKTKTRRAGRKSKKKVTDVTEEDVAQLWEELKDIVPRDIGTVAVWEFLLHLLEDEATYGRMIRWEDRDHGVFRVYETQKVSALWRFYRKKPEKGVSQKRILWAHTSRAMRFHYDKYLVANEEKKSRKIYRFSEAVVEDRLRNL